MDKKINGDLSLRDLYEPGPYLNDLSESVFSNHLGFNIVLTTTDQKIIFIQRSHSTSIGKGKLGLSVAASMKAKYALHNDGVIDSSSLEHAIIKEIEDEMLLDLGDIHFSLAENLLFVYRDLVEGGKPQLVATMTVNMTFEEFHDNFNKRLTPSDSEKLKIDGKELVKAEIDTVKTQLELLESDFSLEIDGQNYELTAPHATALALVIDFWNRSRS